MKQKPAYIAALDIHIDLSEEIRRRLESHGCSCWLQLRASRFEPLWHLVFPQARESSVSRPMEREDESLNR